MHTTEPDEPVEKPLEQKMGSRARMPITLRPQIKAWET